MDRIGTLNEKPLHAALKAWYARAGDRIEAPVDGYVVDIVRDDLLIEIQTRNFSAFKRKLHSLAQTHPVHIVHPIALEKWIVRLGEEGVILSRRKSPKRGQVVDVFAELVHIPALFRLDAITLEVVLIQEDEVRVHDPRRGWRRRGWVVEQRQLLDVVASERFDGPDDLLRLLPLDLPTPFSTADLAAALGRPRRLAQQVAYTLREMGALTPHGKRGNALLYAR